MCKFTDVTTKSRAHYVNVSVLTKFFTKDQCFYLNYHKLSIKSYASVRFTHPQHMILWRYIEIFLSFFILIPTTDFPHFYYMLGRNLGSLLYGDVSVMRRQEILEFQNSIFIIIASLAIKHI